MLNKEIYDLLSTTTELSKLSHAIHCKLLSGTKSADITDAIYKFMDSQPRMSEEFESHLEDIIAAMEGWCSNRSILHPCNYENHDHKWTLHTSIPDLRTRELSELPNDFLELRRESITEMLDAWNIESFETESTPQVSFADGDFYHFKLSCPNGAVYVLNQRLLEEVVGFKKHDIYGYALEIIAYGFFDQTTKSSLREKSRQNKSPIFDGSPLTRSQDKIANAQISRFKID